MNRAELAALVLANARVDEPTQHTEQKELETMSANHVKNRRQKRIDVLSTNDHINRWYISTEQTDGAMAYRTRVTGGDDKDGVELTTEKLRDFAQTLLSHADYLDSNRDREAEEEA